MNNGMGRQEKKSSQSGDDLAEKNRQRLVSTSKCSTKIRPTQSPIWTEIKCCCDEHAAAVTEAFNKGGFDILVREDNPRIMRVEANPSHIEWAFESWEGLQIREVSS